MTRPLACLLCFCTAWTAVSAQPRPIDRAAADLPTDVLTAEFSFSGDEGLDRAGPAGSVAVRRSALATDRRTTLSPSHTLSYGLQLEVHELDSDSGTLLPERLAEIALRLNFSRRLSSTWSASLFLRPGLYGDFEDVDGKTFNVPFLLGASYAKTRDLVWLLGLRANVYAEHPVLPFVGFRWRFAPDWSFNVAFPRSGIEWQASSRLSLNLGVSLQGGTYRIIENLGSPLNTAGRLANTFVDYREIRVGLGAEYALTGRLSVRAEAGAFTDRQFDYYDRDYTLDGDPGIFASVAVRSTF